MAKGLSVKFTISPKVSRLVDTVNENLKVKVLMVALDKAAEQIRAMYPSEVDDSRRSGTKAKQTDRMKAKFPTHISDKISIKKLPPRATSVMRLVGVRRGEAGQVNIHYGKKAMTVGRVHKLWSDTRFAKVNPRITRKDVPKIIQRRARPIVERLIVAEIRSTPLI